MVPENYGFSPVGFSSRSQQPSVGDQKPREYDLNPDDVNDSVSRGLSAVSVMQINFAIAGTLPVVFPGRAFVAYGYTTASAVKAVANNFRLDVGINVSDMSDTSKVFPARHCRGYNGTFNKLYLSWTSQATISCDFVILRSIRDPWMQDQST